MKTFIFNIMREILLAHLPETIGEIGTHKGNSAGQMIDLIAPKVQSLHYTGYDVFDYAVNNVDFNRNERNGKNGAPYDIAIKNFNKLKNRHANFDYTLNCGFTTDTLITPMKFDFVYIDGGHSYETVKHDYSMVKDSKVIIFDDVQIAGVRQFINELFDSNISVELINTPSKHIWAKIVN
jgi:hypothetical protein